MNLITRDELCEKLTRGDEFKLVMTLGDFAYRSKHIPKSIHFETVDEALAALDPADEIIVYCADVYCAASIYAYRLLEREGFTRVRRYAGGIADWEEAGYPLEWELSEPANDRPVEKRPGPKRATTRSGLRPSWKSRPWRICV
jgi:rhodanese-related sulfurtransferase